MQRFSEIGWGVRDDQASSHFNHSHPSDAGGGGSHSEIGFGNLARRFEGGAFEGVGNHQAFGHPKM